MTSTCQTLTAQRCPVTNELMPNATQCFDGYYISYARELSHYGSDTTAIVIGERVFFLLNGDHSSDLLRAAGRGGLQACIELFIDRIEQANSLSEHLMAVGLKSDPFHLQKTLRDAVGDDVACKIEMAAMRAAKGQEGAGDA
ncbi:hypothetical protein [Marinobacter alkaliphilus]|uniref:Uncharacterized protein n=1 Tax=Marinobacter alkaliphilus TaxID=254719 RepID=A0ABZ3E929_9GAMM